MWMWKREDGNLGGYWVYGDSFGKEVGRLFSSSKFLCIHVFQYQIPFWFHPQRMWTLSLCHLHQPTALDGPGIPPEMTHRWALLVGNTLVDILLCWLLLWRMFPELKKKNRNIPLTFSTSTTSIPSLTYQQLDFSSHFKHHFHFFWYPRFDLWVRVSLTEWVNPRGFADLTDVILADTNSMLTGNVAMQVTRPGGQLWEQCKWRYLMTKFGPNASCAIWTRWCHLHWFQSWPSDVTNLAIRWRNFQMLQMWRPGCVTCIALPWIILLALSLRIELVSARVTSVKSQQCQFVC